MVTISKMTTASILAILLWSFLGHNLYGQKAELMNETNSPKPEVGFLWMFHFSSKDNLLTQNFEGVMSKKGQNEIEQLVHSIKEFKPTKIAIERPYYSDKDLNDTYQKYLKGDYVLTNEETDQIAFRLGKLLNHDSLFAVSHRGKFPIDTVLNYARSENQMEYFEKTISLGNRFVGRLDSILETGSIIQALEFTNSTEARKMSHLSYYPLMKIGSDNNPVGIDLVSEWYRTNMMIYRNTSKIAEPNDRILVIYGQGHSEILSNLIENSPDLNLIDMSLYLK